MGVCACVWDCMYVCISSVRHCIYVCVFMCVCARARVCVHARACVCVYVHVCAVLQSRSEGLGPRTVGLVMRRSLLPDLDGSSVPPKARASSAVMSCSPFKSMCAAAVADRL